MSPQSEIEAGGDDGVNKNVGSSVSNNDLVENAGAVHLEEAQLWGRGIWKDMKTTVGTHWVKEMTNFNQKTVAVSLLLFITVIAPTLTFGAVYGKATESRIGAIETLLATGWVGVTYALVGGMPLCVIGSTGPVLAMSTALYNMANSMDVPFLTFNAWVSVWLMFYCVLAGFLDLTRYVKLATRFTDEIFALLIVTIFLMDAIGDPFSDAGILRYSSPGHPSHIDQEGNPDYSYISTALWSIIMGLGTCAMIFFFRCFKFSPFFCSDGFRSNIHDFAVIMSVIMFTCFNELLVKNIWVEQLNVPDRFEPTLSCCDSSCNTAWPKECPDQAEPWGTRSWIVNFGDLNGKGWVAIVAAGPAVLAFLLCYLDSGITWHLINHKSHKIQHGDAYNYDLCLIGLFNFVNGMLGLPWLVATTVPCIIHLNALADKDKDGNFIEVQETRLTLFFSHLLVALSVLVLEVLRLLPMPVLYGVFLFMGLSSLGGLQFWMRIKLFFMQPSRYPDLVYTKYMKKSRIHLYTILQLLFFGGVCAVMNIKAISIVFPFMTFLCIPARLYFLPRFFEGWELVVLDGEDEQIEEWVDAKEDSNRAFHLEDDLEEGDSLEIEELSDSEDIVE